MTRTLALALVFGAAVAIGRATTPDARTPESVETGAAADPDAAPLPRDCAARRAHATGEKQRLQSAVEAKALELRMQRARREEREGPPQPWPEDVPPLLAPEAFRAALHEITEEMGTFTRVEIDCEEHPCLALVVVAEEHQTFEAMPDDELRPLVDALRARGYTGFGFTQLTTNSPAGLAVLAFHVPDASPDHLKRIRSRAERMKLAVERDP